jgi:hypothetical protein
MEEQAERYAQLDREIGEKQVKLLTQFGPEMFTGETRPITESLVKK